ncbi:hypothetical protein ACFFJI_12345 [Allobacillus sp. GCM10007491]|uniref:Uncharacterized protein n=1 Tax=Allobacillus saliphilus TaxID=2912308 RepID=A0A941HU47_9BACI|nr:hypothetical protein [Allobacillus saliphilus]MBR7554572.1 hypothetical protein [Allobacillus saliphilus]
MSEEKKEIHVKDLVIKADRVSFEPPERKDPFFGSGRPDLWKPTDHSKEELEAEHEPSDEHDDGEFDGEERRPPFFWI